MNYAIQVLKNELESEIIVKEKVTGVFKDNIQENIDDLELAIHNLKQLEWKKVERPKNYD